MTPDLQLPKKELENEKYVLKERKTKNLGMKMVQKVLTTAKVIQNALSQIGSVKIIHAQVDLKMAKFLL